MWPAKYPQVWFTYGPHTEQEDTIRELFRAGATGTRFTFSYGTPALQVERANRVRSIAHEMGAECFSVADLQGEKCRLQKIEGLDKIKIKYDQMVELTRAEADATGSPIRLPVQVPSYLDELQSSDMVIIGDGDLVLEVVEIRNSGVLCRCLTRGQDLEIRLGRGILVCKREFRPRALTEKDVDDLRAISHSDCFSAVAISFVGGPSDITFARSILSAENKIMPLIAKIETGLGLQNIDQIAVEADALMAARGDLALTMPWVELPEGVQLISQAAKRNHCPWILATQLVEGMEKFEFPTRAEICDLARWVSQGAFGAMLSFETAWGTRPVASLRAVHEIVSRYKLADLSMR